MSRITEASCSAFHKGHNFKESNTEVIVDDECVVMLLHDNAIASYDIETDEIMITNAGWATRVTKDRLNGLNGVSIAQMNGSWYLNDTFWDGKWMCVPHYMHGAEKSYNIKLEF